MKNHYKSVFRLAAAGQGAETTEPVSLPNTLTRCERPVLALASANASVAQPYKVQLIHRALQELALPCRDCFLLRKSEGLSHPEIAQRLGISRAQVDQHIVAAMKHCRVRLRQWEGH